MTKDKMVQLIGRGLRIHPEDRPKEFNGNYDGWVKPFTYIMIPKVEELKALVEITVKEIRENFDPNVIIQIVDVVDGSEEQENTKHKSKKLRLLQKHRVHEFEEHCLAVKKVKEQIENNEVIVTSYKKMCKKAREELNERKRT